MNRKVWLLPLLAIAILAGCSSDDSSSPTAPQRHAIEIFLPDQVPPAAEGFEIRFPVSARVTLADGSPASGVPVTFRLINSEGLASPETIASDNLGLAQTTFSVLARRGVQKATVAVATSSQTAEAQVTLTGTGRLANIAIAPLNRIPSAPRGAPIRIALRAQLVDADGFGVSGIPLRYALFGDRQEPSGRLSGDSLSRADGSVQFAYDVFCDGSRVEIVLAADTSRWQGDYLADTTMVRVLTAESQIASITVRANPTFLDPDPGETAYSDIRAVVTDLDGVGFPNIVVDFETNLGSLSNVTPTDVNGVASARFQITGELGTATIIATIPGTPFEATASIRMRVRNPVAWVINVTSDVEFIYADNGLTVAHITASLKDGENQPLVGREITFHCPVGAINSSVTTDTLGIARAIFTDIGIPSLDERGNPVPVWIKAKCRQIYAEDSVGVTIRPRNPVTMITLVANKQSVQAGSGDSVTVRATCFLQSGAFARQGTLVSFQVDDANGMFTTETVPVGEFGVAETYYVAGNFVGTAVLRAIVVNDPGGREDRVSSNEVQINLLAGPPSSIRLRVTPNDLNTNDPGAFSTITATVTDTGGNPVSGWQVHFQTDNGELSPPSPWTDSTGRATIRLYPGLESGVAMVWAWVDLPGGRRLEVGPVTVTFHAGFPNSIEIAADPLQIAVAGTGGLSSSTVRATVRDASGNLVERSTTVVFQILNNAAPPLGPNINNHGEIDSARTANGLAVVSVNSGERIGGVLLRAYTWRDPDSSSAGEDRRPRTDTVSVVLSAIAVVAGPPFAIDLDVNSDAIDVGGGMWEVEVSARIWDIHRNPVGDRIPIMFSVDPDVATIENGFTEGGACFARLRYHSSHTFTPIEISAEVQSLEGLITATRQWTLPLQRGRIELFRDPANWMFERDRPNDTCLIRVWALVTDGHGVEINNAPVLFRTDRMRFYWLNLQGNRYVSFFPNVVRRHTGLVNQQNNERRGEATVYLRGVMDDAFLDPFGLELINTIEAQVEGADGVEADPVDVRFTRH